MDVPKPGLHSNPRVTYRGFIARGFASQEAASLTASLYGLPVFTEQQPILWKIREICHIIFLAHEAEKGGKSDDTPITPSPEVV
jgi:hypothetical protein